MATALPHLSDPVDAGAGPRNAFERALAGLLREERDLYFVRLILRLSVVVPLGLSFYLWDFPGWLVLLWIPLLFVGQVGPYTLMLHALVHRPIFRRELRFLEHYVPWVLGPFHGHTPTSFYVHHIGMHHPENNLATDLSSTLPYQRDLFRHWLHYWARFFFFGTVHLMRYLVLRKRDKLIRRFILGEVAWYLAMGALLWLDWRATLVVFITPFLLLRVLMMTGNWGQHAFVDVDDANNAYRNSTCLIHVPYNRKCHNDGYHIVHHIKPALHWTEMARWYEDHKAEFGQNDAIVFDGLGNNQTVFWCLMRGDYDRLARHLVDLPGAPVRDHAAKVAWLQDRVRRKGSARRGMMEMEAPEALAAK